MNAIPSVKCTHTQRISLSNYAIISQQKMLFWLTVVQFVLRSSRSHLKLRHWSCLRRRLHWSCCARLRNLKSRLGLWHWPLTLVEVEEAACALLSLVASTKAALLLGMHLHARLYHSSHLFYKLEGAQQESHTRW